MGVTSTWFAEWHRGLRVRDYVQFAVGANGGISMTPNAELNGCCREELEFTVRIRSGLVERIVRCLLPCF